MTNLILKQHCVFCFLFISCQFWQFIDLLLGETDLWYWHRTLIMDNITDHLPRSRALFSLMTSSRFCWVCFVYFGHCENTETSRQANSMKPDEWCHCGQIVFLAKIYPCACLLCTAEHSRPVGSYNHHPGWHDAPHPLCEGWPRVAASHRLLGHSGVGQLRLRPGNHQIHWDGQDQGHCHQWSHIHGEITSEMFIACRFTEWI